MSNSSSEHSIGSWCFYDKSMARVCVIVGKNVPPTAADEDTYTIQEVDKAGKVIDEIKLVPKAKLWLATGKESKDTTNRINLMKTGYYAAEVTQTVSGRGGGKIPGKKKNVNTGSNKVALASTATATAAATAIFTTVLANLASSLPKKAKVTSTSTKRSASASSIASVDGSVDENSYPNATSTAGGHPNKKSKKTEIASLPLTEEERTVLAMASETVRRQKQQQDESLSQFVHYEEREQQLESLSHVAAIETARITNSKGINLGFSSSASSATATEIVTTSTVASTSTTSDEDSDVLNSSFAWPVVLGCGALLILNPLGRSHPGSCLVADECNIDVALEDKLLSKTPRAKGHTGKRPDTSSVGVMITCRNRKNVMGAVCIDRHLLIITMLIYMQISKVGHYGVEFEKKHYLHIANKLQSDDPSWEFNGILKPFLCEMIFNSSFIKKYLTKWENVHISLTTGIKFKLNCLDGER